jgi:hypothetical protein
MKYIISLTEKWLLIWAFLAMSYITQAQAYQYHPLDTNAIWGLENNHSVFPFTPNERTLWTQNLSGDTTINNQNYKLLHFKGAWRSGYGTAINTHGQFSYVLGGIREDSTKKVYFYSFGNLSSKCGPMYGHFSSTSLLDSVFIANQDYLLYDFGMSVGDSILRYIDNTGSGVQSYQAYVAVVDSIQLNDNTYRKRFQLKGNYLLNTLSTQDTLRYFWIEGIGLLKDMSVLGESVAFEGLLGGINCNWLNISGVEDLTVLGCFKESGFEMYSNNLGYCDTLPPHLVKIEEINIDETVSIKIAPNPFNQQTRISVNNINVEILKVKIFDNTGRLLRVEQSHNNSEMIIHRKELKEGLYFYKLLADERMIGAGKFVIF